MLDAAAELIAAGGLASMTLAAIGERSGYSRGLVTARFGSKEGLVDALIHRVWRMLHDRGVVPLSGEAPGLPGLLALVDGIRELTEQAPGEARALFALMFEALGQDPALRQRMARFHDAMAAEIATTLRRGHDDGSVWADADPERGAALVVATLDGLAFSWLLAPDSIDLAAGYADLGRLIEQRFAPPVDPPPAG